MPFCQAKPEKSLRRILFLNKALGKRLKKLHKKFNKIKFTA